MSARPSRPGPAPFRRPASPVAAAGLSRRGRPGRRPDGARDHRAVLDDERPAHGGLADVVLLGIPTRGAPLARRLAARIAAFEGIACPSARLDITLYRDDLRLRGARALEPTELPDDGIDDRMVVLVDDVLFSGRTSAPRWTRSPTSAGPARSSWRCWSTAATASCRSAPTTSARTSRPRAASR